MHTALALPRISGGCLACRRWAALWTMAALPVLAQQAAVPQPAATSPLAGSVSVSDAFRRLSADTWVSRSVSLADLGQGPIVLGYPESQRELVWRVPPNVPLADATLQMDASFVRADGGRTTLVLSVDGLPASARPVAAERGDGSITLPVDGAPRPAGAVRFKVDWHTALARDNTCADTGTPGNLLRIEPTTRLAYRYDGALLQDVPGAWAALPAAPTVLVTSRELSAQAYDAAWRVGVALERAGRHPRIRTLPAIGDVVDLQGVSVPAVLRHIPAFAALAEGGQHRLRDAAEVGALVALGAAGPVQADIVIGDRSIAGVLAQSLDALQLQMGTEGREAFAQWRERALDGWTRQLAAGQVRVADVFGRPAIVVAQDAGADAAALFSMAGHDPGRAFNVAAADDPRAADLSAVSLEYLGAKPATLDVLSRADWKADFPIASVASLDGKIPSALVIDVAAAPGAGRSAPVASVFLNDVLLAARELEATGRRERIVAPIPRDVLAARNDVRVSFVRQPASDRCRESPEAYPVSVLASSHVLLDKAQPGADFSGLVGRFARGGQLLVPVGYLHDAVATLPRVIALAASTCLSPTRTRFDPLADAGPQQAQGPFLAMDVALKDVDSEVRVQAGRLVLAQGGGHPLLDLGPRSGIVEVVQQGSNRGAIYRSVDGEGPAPDHAFQLSRGNVAVVSAAGVREINTWDPTGQAMLGEARASLAASRQQWVLWTLAAFLVAVIAAGGAWWLWSRRMAARKP